MDFRVDLLRPRERRAAIVVLVSLLVIAGAAVAYLRPPPPRSATAPARLMVTPRPPAPEILSLAIGQRGRLYVVAGDRNWNTSGRRLYDSADGGRTWHPLALPPAAGVPFFADAVRDAPAVVVSTVRPAAGTGYEPDAWRSSDGGATWSRLDYPGGGTPGPLQFQDARHGTWSTGDRDAFRAWTTVDGGRSWRKAVEVQSGGTFAGVPVPVNSAVQFNVTPDGTAWLVIQATPGPGAIPSAPPPRLLRSPDAGGTWYEVPLTPPAALRVGWTTLSPPVLGPQGHGLLVARGYYPVGTGGAMMSAAWRAVTRDGGSSWSDFVPEDHADIALAPDGTWWSATGGQLARSADLGATWSAATPRLPRGTSLGRITFVSASEAWSMYGLYDGPPPDRGYLLHTTDGGATWMQVLGPAA